MTVLISKSERDTIGIDSFERAIIWSGCLILSTKNEVSTNYDKNYQINIDSENSEVILSINLPLDMSLYWSSMSNIISAVQSISDLTVAYTGTNLSKNKVLETEPNTVTNLERYFVWSCQRLQEYYLKNNYDKKDAINISASLKTSTLDISATLAYSTVDYANSNNLLQSVIVVSK